MPSTTRSQRKKLGMKPSQISAERSIASKQSSPRPEPKSSSPDRNPQGKLKANDGKEQAPPVDKTGQKSADQEDGYDELTDKEQHDASYNQDHAHQMPAVKLRHNTNYTLWNQELLKSGKDPKQMGKIKNQPTGNLKSESHSTSETKSVEEKALHSAGFLLLVSVLVLIAAVLVYLYMYMPGDKPASVVQLDYTQRMQNLKSLFPTQGEHFWDIVEATVNGHLAQGSNPVVPIVLLFGSRPDAADSTKCLAEKLGTLLSETLLAKRTGMALINGKDYMNMDSDVAKEGIDQRLQAAFEGGQKAAVVLSLDALPPCSILLFHSYCENEDARYKDAVMIFTVTLKEGHPPSRELIRSKPLNLMGKEAFEISDHLTQVWTDKCHMLPQGKVEAMLSRVANNVAIVQKENVVPC